MAYPSNWSGGRNPQDQDVPTRLEVVPRYDARTARNNRNGLIHFDLDVLNTMVGTFSASHPQTPVFKVREIRTCTNSHSGSNFKFSR